MQLIIVLDVLQGHMVHDLPCYNVAGPLATACKATYRAREKE